MVFNKWRSLKYFLQWKMEIGNWHLYHYYGWNYKYHLISDCILYHFLFSFFRTHFSHTQTRLSTLTFCLVAFYPLKFFNFYKMIFFPFNDFLLIMFLYTILYFHPFYTILFLRKKIDNWWSSKHYTRAKFQQAPALCIALSLVLCCMWHK